MTFLRQPRHYAYRCTTSERDEIVAANRGLIGLVVKRLRHADLVSLGGWDDAFQLGYIALMRAAELYNPEKLSAGRNPGRKAGFSTYAYWSIRHYLVNAVADGALLHVARKEWYRRRRFDEHIPVAFQWPETKRRGYFLNPWAGMVSTLDPEASPEPDLHANDDLHFALDQLLLRERALLRDRFDRGMILRQMARPGCNKDAVQRGLRKIFAKLRELMTA